MVISTLIAVFLNFADDGKYRYQIVLQVQYIGQRW